MGGLRVRIVRIRIYFGSRATELNDGLDVTCRGTRTVKEDSKDFCMRI